MITKTVFIIFMFLSITAFSQKVSLPEAELIAGHFFEKTNNKNLVSAEHLTEKIYSDKNGELLFYVFNYKNAFLVISADKRNIPVKAFSFLHPLKTEYDDSEVHMINILKYDYELFNEYLKNNPGAGTENRKKRNEIFESFLSKNNSDITLGPYLASLFGQVNCKDNNGNYINVTNYYTPDNYAAGCVAITFMTVMHYFAWPRKGVGSFSYTDSYGSSTGTYSADFEEKYYNYDLMKNRYYGVESTDKERSELGKLAFHAAVSVRMDFENGGSTSNINRIPSAASKYFRYIADYKEKTASDFWQTLDTGLHHGIPAQFAVYTDGGAGHAVVGDGIKYVGSEKYYHLNMGWWGTDNGWYQIHQSFNAGGYTNVTAAVLNMIPVPELDDSPELDIESKSAVLKWYYSERLSVQNYELQIKRGPADWETLTDTLTVNTYTFVTDGNTEYSFRIRAKVNGVWADNSWSNEIKIIPSDFKPEGDETLTLYPSVAYDEIKVSWKNLSGSKIRIYNIQGALSYESNDIVSDNEFRINISSLEPGIYLLQVINETENKTSKFLKL